MSPPPLTSRFCFRPVWLAASLTACLAAGKPILAAEAPPETSADKLLADGNWAEAYQRYRAELLANQLLRADGARAIANAANCLGRLNRQSELDGFLEAVVEASGDDWRRLAAAAAAYRDAPHYGATVDDEFVRGRPRGRAAWTQSAARDRVRALQLYEQAILVIQRRGAPGGDAANLLIDAAGAVLQNRRGRAAWRLQRATDLSTLPEPGADDGGGATGAPVDADGEPVLYNEPKDWAAAANDGERLRWLLAEAVRRDPNRKVEALLARALFARSQFGVQTLGGMLRGYQPGDRQDAVFALHTLSDDETIARLATGVRRFTLPAEHHPVRLYQQALDAAIEAKQPGAHQIAATIAGVLLDRRQHPRAAEAVRRAISLARDAESKRSHRRLLDQIVGGWGEFQAVSTQPAGRGATVDFRYRNAEAVELTAQRIDVDRLLGDVKALLKSNPRRLEWDRLQPEEIGRYLFSSGQQKYVGEEVASWSVKLDPLPEHFDRTTTITTPLQSAGAYLVTAKVVGGNTCRVVLWVAALAIIRKPMAGKELFFVGDARTGRPVAGASVELFGYHQERDKDNPRSRRVVTAGFAEKTPVKGFVTLDVAGNKLTPNYQWMAIATTADGRRAFLGFDRFWRRAIDSERPTNASAYVITDRPVYRPGQTVRFKAWVQQASYGKDQDESPFAHQSFRVVVTDPKGEELESLTLTANAYGGIEGEYEAPTGATLGRYRVNVSGWGAVAFRVEEYKKPEFEVEVIAPQESVALGDKFQARVRAKYYFGSPVSAGTVKYKVERTRRDTAWYPPSPWDWLYGPGYWWFGSDAPWYPGWARWGCRAPRESWMRGWGGFGRPELVAEGEAPLDTDGEFALEIDTTLAKELHGDSDHSYRVTAELVDASRRVITGGGEVVVARKPFHVFVWPDRGHYRVGDSVTISAAARRPGGEPVSGLGKLRLLKITYPEGGANADGQSADPRETEVRQWELPTGADGRATLQIKASEPGRYRIAYELPDGAGGSIDGGYLFTIAGEGFDGSGFAYNDLELVPDKRDYAPGDKLRLRINTNRTGGAVLLFVGARDGVYPAPRLVPIAGKSTVVELDITADDAPNFYVEAVTIAGAQTHTVAKQIAVPPVSRAISVEVLPSAEAYLPGQEATIKLRLTDHTGEPLVGETVAAVYDRSLEYISGGPNVGDILQHFWSWRRNHSPRGGSTLDRRTRNLLRPGESGMQRLGRFGAAVGFVTSRTGAESRRGRVAPPQAPTPAAMEAGAEMSLMEDSADGDGFAYGGSAEEAELSPAPVEPAIRENFADTAFWAGSLETDASGIAQVRFTMPENLSAWKIRVWGLGGGARVGEGKAGVVTRKNLLVRLQTPRFLVERDEVVLSANVHNYLDEAKRVTVRLELDGKQLEAPSSLETAIDVPAGEDRRVDWRLKALVEGDAVVRALALTDKESDAMQLTVPVVVHGAETVDAFTGVIARNAQRGAFEFSVPEQRRPEATRLEVTYSPTLAGAMLDALPYLIEYPHGCTEQTLNRFLPAVITQRTLRRMGVGLGEITDGGQAAAREGGKPAWRGDASPVFDPAELDKIVDAGLRRLNNMQLSDGGWGWFSGYGERSSPHTTAVVVRGLLVAKQADVAVVPGMLDGGVAWLQRWQQKQLAALANVDAAGNRIDKQRPSKRHADNLDALVHAVLCDAGRTDAKMRDRLYQDRLRLAPYALAMLGVALDVEGGQRIKRDMVIRNLKQYLVTDAENQTAYLNLPGGYWWYWYGSEFEAHAYTLKLLTRTEPDGEAAAGLVKYLVANRKHATYWNSTRDTALVVEAMADYLQATGEGRTDMIVEVWLDGERRKEVAISGDDFLRHDHRLVIDGATLEPGRHTLELRKRGGGRLYWSGWLNNFSTEDDLRARGLEVRVQRRLYKLTPKAERIDLAGARGQALATTAAGFDRTEVTNLASVKSGDLVEVELTLESKNDYEYLMVTDRKAAGFEPVDVRSGYTGNQLGAYVEYRDQQVNLFLRTLPRGKRSVNYRLRAEAPGRFSALPAEVAAMYAPQLRGNSDELKVRVLDSSSVAAEVGAENEED
ncbi:MAG: MG2 domain-containing protein [Planctomycetota bacterium]